MRQSIDVCRWKMISQINFISFVGLSTMLKSDVLLQMRFLFKFFKIDYKEFEYKIIGLKKVVGKGSFFIIIKTLIILRIISEK